MGDNRKRRARVAALAAGSLLAGTAAPAGQHDNGTTGHYDGGSAPAGHVDGG